MKLYRSIIREEWIGTIVIVAIWFALGRSASELGLVPDFGAAAWAGYALTGVILRLMYWQLRSVTHHPENHEAFRKKIGSLSFITPHTKQEVRAFNLVSVTAGVCEEIIFRGFLMAYLMSWLGVPFWGAALLSSLGFGLAHMYQGPLGIPRTGFVGLGMAYLYGLTGSLWAPIVVHAVMDLFAGRMSHAAFTSETPEDTSQKLAA